MNKIYNKEKKYKLLIITYNYYLIIPEVLLVSIIKEKEYIIDLVYLSYLLYNYLLNYLSH